MHLQAVMKKCTENQTRAMIKQAATSTDERKKNIIEILRALQPNQSPTVQQFGLRLNSSFAKIDARILNAPALEYGQQKTITPIAGVWRPDNLPFIAAVKGITWGCLILDGRTPENAVNAFCNTVSIFMISTTLR